MKLPWAGAVALLAFFLTAPLAAQPARELRGQVFHLGENGERLLEPGLIVTLVETGATDDTNDQGIFRLPLPPAFQPGDSVTIAIDKPGWRIRYPLDGETRVPRDPLREIVPLELLPVGSKLFWTNDRIEKLIRDASERSKQEARREVEAAPVLDLGREIKEWAAKYGFSVQEARDEIDRWIAEVEAAHENSYQEGLAAFARQHFDLAAEHFQQSAELHIRQLDETREQQETLAEKAERMQQDLVRNLRLAGDSHLHAHRFEQALAAYEQAHQYTSKDQTPLLWGATLNDIGCAHLELGTSVAGAESPAHIAAAAQAHRQALLVLTREQMPQDWAVTQSDLGTALAEQGTRTPGEEGEKLLAQAVDAYQQALLVLTPDQVLAQAPDHRQACELLGMTLSNRLFHPQEAVALTRNWLRRHPEDLRARLALGEQLFASRAFLDSSREIAALLREQALDASSHIVAMGYTIAAGLMMDSAAVPNQIEELLGVVAAQPQGFSISWKFEGTLHSLGEDSEAPRKDLLIHLFQALKAPDRDSMLNSLRDVKKAIEPEGRPAN
ncbi:MAG TPA: hypothetical protein VFR03_03590 [Thermoanaerobaculia bacterium]|nr:hypothetical protein [Thermoanaerobaculia bacterium]